ncbi:IS200/IS605 family transposase [Streptomyces sp. NPDC050546]|uniref:IS200/IS605 family transposase n=1 Tax=Streptomyces sp. NPDC050546 TaxID=3365628 RepID=UPI0037AB2765
MSPRWNPNPDVRTGRHVVYNLHVPLVFVTKYRRKAFTDAMLTRTEEIMREVCDDFEAELKQFNGEQDHVHLIVHYPPKVQLSKLVNSLKGVSSGSYFAGSCGGAPLTVVKQYIENQQRPV